MSSQLNILTTTATEFPGKFRIVSRNYRMIFCGNICHKVSSLWLRYRAAYRINEKEEDHIGVTFLDLKLITYDLSNWNGDCPECVSKT